MSPDAGAFPAEIIVGIPKRRAIAASRRLAMARLRLARARGWPAPAHPCSSAFPASPGRSDRRSLCVLGVFVRPWLRSPLASGVLIVVDPGCLRVLDAVRVYASLGGLPFFVFYPSCDLRRRLPVLSFRLLPALLCVSSGADFLGRFHISIVRANYFLSYTLYA